MIYPKFVKKGDTLGIVALSAGVGKKLDDFNKKLQQTVREMYEEKGILPKGYSLTDIQ